MWSWYGNVPSSSWQCGNVIISCVSRVLNQVFQYLRRPLLKHQSYQLRDIVQRNFRPACSTHLERSVAWKQLSGDVLVQEFRVLVVTGCEGMASRGSSNRRRDLKKKDLRVWWHALILANLYNLSINTFPHWLKHHSTFWKYAKPGTQMIFSCSLSHSPCQCIYMTPSIETRVTGGWHWCRGIGSAEMVEGQASMPISWSKNVCLNLKNIKFSIHCFSFIFSVHIVIRRIPALCRSIFNPQHLSDGTHVLLGHRDGAGLPAHVVKVKPLKCNGFQTMWSWLGWASQTKRLWEPFPLLWSFKDVCCAAPCSFLPANTV